MSLVDVACAVARARERAAAPIAREVMPARWRAYVAVPLVIALWLAYLGALAELAHLVNP